MENINFILTILLIISWIALIFLLKDMKSRKAFMREIIESSKKVKNMDFNSKINRQSYPEFSAFVDDYNNMINMLERSFDVVEGKNIQLNSILKSVSNGILVIDINNKVFLMNDRAKKYLDCPLENIVERKSIYDVIKDRKILKFIKHNINVDRNVTKELRLKDGKIYRIKIDPISMESRKTILIASIINIEDITERIKLENMRRDFAANVSHELKTPLTSIQGFVETLKENEDTIDSSTRMRFLDIIDSESQRLKMLINDILLLSSIEGEDMVNFEEFDLDSLMERVSELLEKKLKKYGVKLIVENYIGNKFEGSIIYSQKQYFKELLLNLLTNGIKYNKVGGFVKIVFSEDDENYRIKVIDNGIGISSEETERIFERFYRVDKARNKDIDGTGLGLAIVKHIVISLGGHIVLESEINVGSKFTIYLPKNNKTIYLDENNV